MEQYWWIVVIHIFIHMGQYWWIVVIHIFIHGDSTGGL
jgi:hypothetical protein